MKLLTTGALAVMFSLGIHSQEIIELPHNETGGIVYGKDEKRYYSEIWKKHVVSNVSKPTLQIFKPKQVKANGTSIVLAPNSGGFFVHEKEVETEQAIRYMNRKGITVFLLKYRLAPTGRDAVAEVRKLVKKDKEELYERAKEVLPLTVKDGLNAITYIRNNAAKFGVEKNKIGFMGFSEGGALTMGVATNYDNNNRPDFLVPVYPWTKVIEAEDPKKDAPPMLIISNNDYPEAEFNKSLAIYEKWSEDNLNVELYTSSEKNEKAKNGKDKNIRNQGWINRFYDWSVSEGLISSTAD